MRKTDIITAVSIKEKSGVYLATGEDGNFVILRKITGENHAILFRHLQAENSPYFPQILEIEAKDGETIVLEEYLEGRPLSELMGEELGETEAFDYMEQLLEAIRVLHHLNPPIIHRDVKPENILITKEGRLKLLDFDAAREGGDASKEQDTILLGTRGYAAPEQFGYHQTDERSDLYSAGIVCGQLGEKVPLSKRKRKRFQHFLDKATMFDPKERFRCADEMITALKEVRNAKAGIRFVLVFASVAAMTALALFVWGLLHENEAENASDETTSERMTTVVDFEVLPKEYCARLIGSRVRRADEETKGKRRQLENIPIPYDAEGADGFFRLDQECAIGTQYPLLRFLKAYPQAILIQDYRCEFASIDDIRLERYSEGGEKVLEHLRLAEDSFEIRDGMLCLKADALSKLNPGIYLLAFRLHYKEDWEYCRYLQVHGEEEKVDNFGARLLQPIQYYSPSLDNDVFFYVYNTPWTIRTVLRDGEEVQGDSYVLTLDGKGVILKTGFFEGVDQSSEITIEMENGRKAYGRVLIIP